MLYQPTGGGFGDIDYVGLGNGPTSLVTMDIDGDSDPDFAVSNLDGAVTLVRSPGLSTQSIAVGGAPTDLTWADGLYVATGENVTALAYDPDSDSLFVTAVAASTGADVAVCDVNDDGRLDVVTSNPSTPSVRIALGKVGGPDFYPAVATATAGADDLLCLSMSGGDAIVTTDADGGTLTILRP